MIVLFHYALDSTLISSNILSFRLTHDKIGPLPHRTIGPDDIDLLGSYDPSFVDA